MTRAVPIRLALLACLGLCLPAAAAGSEQEEGGFVGQVALGYRSVDVGGSENKYREDVNLADGPLLYHLSFNLVPDGTVRSAVDEIWADLNDVGGQPFETYRFGLRKHGSYTFTYDRQESDYFYNDTLLTDGAAVPDPETWDVRRVRQRAKLGLELNPMLVKLSRSRLQSTKRQNAPCGARVSEPPAHKSDDTSFPTIALTAAQSRTWASTSSSSE